MQEQRITYGEFATRVVIGLMKKFGVKKRAETEVPPWNEAMKGQGDVKKFVRLHGRVFGMLFFLFFSSFVWFYVLYTCAHPESDVKHNFNQPKISAPEPGASPSQQPAAPPPTIDAPIAAAPAPTAPAAVAAAPMSAPPAPQPAVQGNQFGVPMQQQPMGGGAVYAAGTYPAIVYPEANVKPMDQNVPAYDQAPVIIGGGGTRADGIQPSGGMPSAYTVYTTNYSNTSPYGTVPPAPMMMAPQTVSHNADFSGTYATPTGRFKVIAPR